MQTGAIAERVVTVSHPTRGPALFCAVRGLWTFAQNGVASRPRLPNMNGVRRGPLAFAVVALLAVAGCASLSTSAKRPGTVTGTVLSGPRCPGPEGAGSPCPPGPVDG